jgi:hypothetical protein
LEKGDYVLLKLVGKKSVVHYAARIMNVLEDTRMRNELPETYKEVENISLLLLRTKGLSADQLVIMSPF